ncbi:MAG: hypothetical protein H6713_37545 [Myxococcales bacterium]|nr:hypothetical protein [Myxococcales bacterium]
MTPAATPRSGCSPPTLVALAYDVGSTALEHARSIDQVAPVVPAADRVAS